jgi:Putative MetA-pathway of phenol degradation
MQRMAIGAGAVLCAVALDASASCGAAFCTVNTDWSAQGAWTDSGARFDLRYEHVDLDQPRAGTERIGVGAVPRHHDEVYTRNRNLIASADWALSPEWAVSLVVPYIDREHFHIHNHHGEQIEDRWDFRGLGDVRVQARYVLSATADASLPCSTGVTFGLKLPTGKHDLANGGGDPAERTLQPGTGTTDALLGAYWHGTDPLAGWSYFTRAQVAIPLGTSDGFKPGMVFQADAGVRYAVNARLALMLQANAQVKARDRGINAEPEDSGQRVVHVSPGVSWNVGREAQLYAFVQLPVYQQVNGVQLTADWSAVAGMSWRF